MLWGDLGATEIPDSLSILGLETTMASFTAHEHAWVEFPAIQRTVGPCQSSTEKNQTGGENTSLENGQRRSVPPKPGGFLLTSLQPVPICYFSSHNYFQKIKKGSTLPELPWRSDSPSLFTTLKFYYSPTMQCQTPTSHMKEMKRKRAKPGPGPHPSIPDDQV